MNLLKIEKVCRSTFQTRIMHEFHSCLMLCHMPSGLIFGVVLPLAMVLRFPGLVLGALRGLAFLPLLWFRFVPWEVQAAVYVRLWQRYVDQEREKQRRGSQRRKRGSRPWDK